MALDTDVLIVGAGPIGLANAWGLKRLNPNLKIVVLEKYSEYQRSHTLIMQPEQLEALMKAADAEQDPTLAALLAQIKKDPHIRTNALQTIFTRLATESGVEIKTQHAVQEESINQMIPEEYPHLSLIIGADGTHSVVSDALFPSGNQVKHEFDFVLQLRFEVNGEEKALGIKTEEFYQQMARKGLIANEYVGHFAEGKTPVTMQMMISKEEFLTLQSATSKNPIRPYASQDSKEKQSGEPNLPPLLNSFLTSYLSCKIADCHKLGQLIDKDSIRISVNEAPATHAKKVVTTRNQAFVVLEGDAALGLSYFKGLNAGLEASSRFLQTLSPCIKESFQNKKAMETQLNSYQNWFLKEFSPQKVKEVGEYSFWRIRSFMKAMKVARGVKQCFSLIEFDEDLDPAIADYFKYVTQDPLMKDSDNKWDIFPHRDYELVSLGQWQYVPLEHTSHKIIKIFSDFFRPYKSRDQILQDYRQPFIGILHGIVGLGKVLAGLITLNPRLLADGLFTLFRGTIELLTTPLTWLVKPITRGIATLIHGGYQKIEENKGMQRLAQLGEEQLTVKKSDLNSNQTIYQLLSICNDMHRKFEKSQKRGQDTELGVEEYRSYSEIRGDTVMDSQKLIHYFSLFTPAREKIEVGPEQVIESKKTGKI